MANNPKSPATDVEGDARSLSRWENEGGAKAAEGGLRKSAWRSPRLDLARSAVAFVGLVAALFGGWFGSAEWIAIPLGAIAFVGSMKAFPERTGPIAAAGVIAYILAAFLLMKAGGWAHGAFA